MPAWVVGFDSARYVGSGGVGVGSFWSGAAGREESGIFFQKSACY